MDDLKKPPLISGWGRTIFARPSCVISVLDVLEDIPRDRGAIPAGNFRSYGDSALNSNGICISTNSLKSITFFEDSSMVRCGSGVTFGELERAAIMQMKYPYVVPGTEFVTIGGAIAADIHGKSHHKVGSFCDHIRKIKIQLANGEILDLFPDGLSKNWFKATCAGLGLTGTIIEADVELQRIHSSYIRCKNIKFRNLAELSNLLQIHDNSHQYSVVWIDISGRYTGRGIISLGNHARGEDIRRIPSRKLFRKSHPGKLKLSFGRGQNLITPFTVMMFNSLWFYKLDLKRNVDIRKFMHPLDGIINWNYLYGKHGFIQYQFVIPLNKFAFLEELLTLLKVQRIASPMAVLKKMGAESVGFLGFSIPGWSLAIDIPTNTPNLRDFLNYLDSRVIELGGKVYLVKDSRLSKDSFRKMYNEFPSWKAVKAEMDPTNFWKSDQARRLDI